MNEFEGHIIDPSNLWNDPMLTEYVTYEYNGVTFRMEKEKYELLQSLGRTHILIFRGTPFLISKEIFDGLKDRGILKKKNIK